MGMYIAAVEALEDEAFQVRAAQRRREGQIR